MKMIEVAIRDLSIELNVDGVWLPSLFSLFLAEKLLDVASALQGKTVIDVGCGSGIHGIVSGLLGAELVIFADIDATSVKVAEENAGRNRVKTSLPFQVRAVVSDLLTSPELPDEVDCIVCNPFQKYSPLQTAECFSHRLKNDGRTMLDPLLFQAYGKLKRGGMLLFTQSSLSDYPKTVQQLARFDVSNLGHLCLPFTLDKGVDWVLECPFDSLGNQRFHIVYTTTDVVYYETVYLVKAIRR